jgi:hypothetical protein
MIGDAIFNGIVQLAHRDRERLTAAFLMVEPREWRQISKQSSIAVSSFQHPIDHCGRQEKHRETRDCVLQAVHKEDAHRDGGQNN